LLQHFVSLGFKRKLERTGAANREDLVGRRLSSKAPGVDPRPAVFPLQWINQIVNDLLKAGTDAGDY
jgi:hypothetical protein